jgi:ankyrin repeat protein
MSIDQISKSKRGRYPRLELWRSNPTKTCSFSHDQTSFDSIQASMMSTNDVFHGLDINKVIGQSPYLNKLRLADIESNILFMNNSFLPIVCNDRYLHEELLRKLINVQPEYLSLSVEKVLGPRLGFYMLSLGDRISSSGHQDVIHLANEIFLSTEEDFTGKFSSSLYNSFADYRKLLWQGGLSAVRRGDAQMIDQLLQLGWDPSLETDRSGRTPLMWACSLAKSVFSLSIVKSLACSDGRNANPVLERTLHNETCMHWAAEGGSLDIAKFIYVKGCDPNLVNHDGTSPLHWAVGSGSMEIADWMVNELGLPANLRNKFGCALSHFAASGGHISSCEWLLNLGCDFSEENHHGHDPLTKAVAFKNNHIVDWLLRNIPALKQHLSTKRPWNLDTTKPHEIDLLTLHDIAMIVGNNEALPILEAHAKEIPKLLSSSRMS